MSFKRLISTAAITSSFCFATAHAAEVVFYISEDGGAADAVSVSVNGQRRIVNPQGFVTFELPADSYTAELSQYGAWVGEADFTLENYDSSKDVFVEILGGEAIAETSSSDAAGGVIKGQLISNETGGPVSGARVSAAGTELGVITDDDGNFSLELPRGNYTLTVAHPSYQRAELNVNSMPGVPVDLNVEVGMSGNGVIEEVVAVGTYVADSATSQERDASAVLDSIGGEQMSRFGDSNAASALKRVAGVTIADGKYVVARGLNERHTSILLNGASLPSPDPSRRVVPLDLFPSSVIDGIDVQKTATPDVYADSTGSTVSLSTKKFPLEFEGKLSLSLGYNDSATFTEQEFMQEEGGDFFGFGADGDRALNQDAKEFSSESLLFNPELGKNLVAELPDNLNTEERNVLPDISAELSMGDTFYDNGNTAYGYQASVKFSNEWQVQERESDTNLLGEDGELNVDDSYDETRTTNDVNLGFGLSLGMLSGIHEVTSNTLLLRQTHSETSVKRGTGGDQDREGILYNMDWLERQLFMQQFTGEHYFDRFLKTTAQWQISFSEAELDNPDRRRYTYEIPAFDEGLDDYYLYWSEVKREYNTLSDSITDYSVSFDSSLFESSTNYLTADYGFSAFTREREADGTTLGYDANSGLAGDYINNFDIDQIVTETIAADELSLLNQTAGSADYNASWDMTALFGGIEYERLEVFRVNAGLRSESSDISVQTYESSAQDQSNPIYAEISDSNVYPSAGLTVFLGESVQLRGAWYQTINRPDFRELANAQYVDPDTGDNIRGYPLLESAEITNIDVRAEWYMSENESISLAYFTKNFDKPIEKTLLTGGSVFSYRNGDTGTINGVEIDFRSEFDLSSYLMFVSGNLSLIDSEVDIAFRSRAMQGQPDSLANVQIGLDDYDSQQKFTLVYNYHGELLYSATQANSNSPDIMEDPRGELSANYSTEIVPDLTFKVALKNITDEPVSLTQKGENYRSYRKGREVSAGISLVF